MTDLPHNRIRDLIVAIFQEWRRAGVPFLILRNYEQLPDHPGNDIDVLVAAAGRPAAEELLLSVARAHGFELLIRAEFSTRALFLGRLDTGDQIHIDLFVGFWWRGFRLLDSSGFLDRRRDTGLFFIPHPADEAVNSLVNYLVYAGKVKEKYRAGIQAAFRAEAETARHALALTYGSAQAQELVTLAVAGDWDAIGRQVPALRRTLVARQLGREPVRTLAFLAGTAVRWLDRWLRPPGMVVVLCGADGCGKSTVSPLLAAEVARTFVPDKGAHYHWKPPVFTGQRQAHRAPTTDPHSRPPRSVPVSLVFFAVHWLEFFVGAFTRLRPTTFRAGLVLVDRYYYDFFVDQRRYRLSVPQSLVWLGCRLLPKPDLVFALDAPAAVLRQRKQEVSEAETVRQRQAYAELTAKLPNGRVIDATQPPQQVAAAMRREIFTCLARRARVR